MKRIRLDQTNGKDFPSHVAAVETNVFTRCHPLVAFMAETRYDDGEPRKPGEIKIWVKGASWNVQLLDLDAKAFITVAASSLDDALALACLALETENAPWEEAFWLRKGKGK